MNKVHPIVPLLPPYEIREILAKKLPPAEENRAFTQLLTNQKVRSATRTWAHSHHTAINHIPRLHRFRRFSILPSSIFGCFSRPNPTLQAKTLLLNWSIDRSWFRNVQAQISEEVVTLLEQEDLRTVIQFLDDFYCRPNREDAGKLWPLIKKIVESDAVSREDKLRLSASFVAKKDLLIVEQLTALPFSPYDHLQFIKDRELSEPVCIHIRKNIVPNQEKLYDLIRQILEKDPENPYLPTILDCSRKKMAERYKAHVFDKMSEKTIKYLKEHWKDFKDLVGIICCYNLDDVFDREECPENKLITAIKKHYLAEDLSFFYYDGGKEIFLENKESPFFWTYLLPRLFTDLTIDDHIAYSEKVFKAMCSGTHNVFPRTLEYWMKKFEGKDIRKLFESNDPRLIAAALPWLKEHAFQFDRPHPLLSQPIKEETLAKNLLKAIDYLHPKLYVEWVDLIHNHLPSAHQEYTQRCLNKRADSLSKVLPILLDHGFVFDEKHPWLPSIISSEEQIKNGEIQEVVYRWINSHTEQNYIKHLPIILQSNFQLRFYERISYTKQVLTSSEISFSVKISLWRIFVGLHELKAEKSNIYKIWFLEDFSIKDVFKLPLLTMAEKLTLFADCNYQKLPHKEVKQSIQEILDSNKDSLNELIAKVIELFLELNDKESVNWPLSSLIMEGFKVLSGDSIATILSTKNSKGITPIMEDTTWNCILEKFRTEWSKYKQVFVKLDGEQVISKQLKLVAAKQKSIVPFSAFKHYLPYLLTLNPNEIFEVLTSLQDHHNATVLFTFLDDMIPLLEKLSEDQNVALLSQRNTFDSTPFYMNTFKKVMPFLLKMSSKNLEMVLSSRTKYIPRPWIPYTVIVQLLPKLEIEACKRLFEIQACSPVYSEEKILPTIEELKQLDVERRTILLLSHEEGKTLLLQWYESGLLDNEFVASTFNMTVYPKQADGDDSPLATIRNLPLQRLIRGKMPSLPLVHFLSLQTIFGEVYADVLKEQFSNFLAAVAINPQHMFEGISVKEAIPAAYDMNTVKFVGRKRKARYVTSYAFLDDMIAAAQSDGTLDIATHAKWVAMKNKISKNLAIGDISQDPQTRLQQYNSYCAYLTHIVAAYKIGQNDGNKNEKIRVLKEIGDLQMNCFPRWMEQIQQLYFSRPDQLRQRTVIFTLKDRILAQLRNLRIDIVKTKLISYEALDKQGVYVHEPNYLSDIFNAELGLLVDPINDPENIWFVNNRFYESKVLKQKKFHDVFYTKEFLVNTILEHINTQKKRKGKSVDPLDLNADEVESHLESWFISQWTIEKSEQIISEVKQLQDDDEIEELLGYYGIEWPHGLSVNETEIQLEAQLKGADRALNNVLSQVRKEIAAINSKNAVDVKNLIERYSQISKDRDMDLDGFIGAVNAWEKKLKADKVKVSDVLRDLGGKKEEEKRVYLKEKELLKEGMKLEEVLQHNHIRKCRTRCFIEEEVYDGERLFTQKAAACLLVSCGVLTAT